MGHGAIAAEAMPINGKASGWLNGLIGVLIFSGSLPATRMAVATIDPVFLTFAHAAIAGLVGGSVLLTLRSRRFRSSQR